MANVVKVRPTTHPQAGSPCYSRHPFYDKVATDHMTSLHVRLPYFQSAFDYIVPKPVDIMQTALAPWPPDTRHPKGDPVAQGD